jgi:hypothetical protein
MCVCVWQAGQQVVNEALQMQPQGKPAQGGRNKGGAQNAVNQKAAATNRATPSRPFAVQQKTPPPKPGNNPTVAKVVKHDKWAGGAFLNSPAPSALPMPSIVMPGGPPAGAAGNPALLDPAIVTTSSQQKPSVPPVLLPPGARVNAQFLDGEWYDGVVQGSFASGHLVLFEGFESEGPYEITFDLIQPYAHPSLSAALQQQDQHALPAASMGGMQMQHVAPAPHAGGVLPTSLADLEKQLLSTSPPTRGDK